MEEENRIYIVSAFNLDGEPYSFDKDDIYCMTDEDFIEEAEGQGFVWSSWKYFQADYNLGYVPNPKDSVMRIIEVKYDE